MSKDSRKNERYDASEGATAALVTPEDKEHYAGIGEIVDISMGGLCLQYDSKAGSYEGFVDIDVEIFGYSSQRLRMYVGRLPCKIIYDRLLATDDQRALETRQVGLKFEDVPYFKLHKLSNFVELFTKARKESSCQQDKTDKK